MIDTGIVPRLVALLQSADAALQFEAAWALTNIASGNSEHTRAVVEARGIPEFVNLLQSPHLDVQEQAMWAIGNIAGDSVSVKSFWCNAAVVDSGLTLPVQTAMRDLALEAGALRSIAATLAHVEDARVSIVRNATWTISNLCRGKPQPALEAVSPALPLLASLIHHADQEVQTDACWALSYVSDGDNARIQAVLETGVVNRVVELLGADNLAVATPALRAVGNIVTGDDAQTQVVLNAGVMPRLSELLTSPKKSIRKESAWAISNVTAGSQEQIQVVLNSGLVGRLLEVLTRDEVDVRKEAAWAVSNAISGGSPDQIEFLVAQGALPALVSVLHEGVDARIATVGLEGIEGILRVGQSRAEVRGGAENPYCDALEACGGIDKVEELQNHADEDVYSRALRILETYFVVGEDSGNDSDDQGHAQAPVAPAPGGAFAFAVPGNAANDVDDVAQGVQAMVVEDVE